MTDLGKLFSDILGAAMQLDIPALRSEINDGRDDGLRAASYDSAGGRSADVSSHPERLALNPRRDRTDADLERLESLVASYVAAVHWLATRSHSGPFPTDWPTARLGHQRLVDMDAITTLENIRIPPGRWVHAAADSLHDLEALARRHETRREPTEDEKHWHDGTNVNDVCTWHLAIHQRHRRPRVPGTNICATCQALVLAGEGARPPAWLLEAEVGRGSRPKAWTAALSRWLDELGVLRSA